MRLNNAGVRGPAPALHRAARASRPSARLRRPGADRAATRRGSARCAARGWRWTAGRHRQGRSAAGVAPGRRPAARGCAARRLGYRGGAPGEEPHDHIDRIGRAAAASRGPRPALGRPGLGCRARRALRGRRCATARSSTSPRREAPTVRDLLELDDPAGWLARGRRAARSARSTSSPRRRWPATAARPRLLAPCDLQALKACGVTFARSMVERVIEERAAGDPAKAEAIRGADRRADRRVSLRDIVPGSEAAAAAKAALHGRGAVEPVSRGRHRPGRRGLHQGPADVGGRLGRDGRPAPGLAAGTTPSPRWCWRSTAAAASVGASARQRREPARRRGALGAAARQGQGQQRRLRHRAVHPALRRRLRRSTTCARPSWR